MKREPLPTIEQLSEEIRHVDLSPLKNRLAGKSLVDFEHCLIDILGELFECQRNYSSYIADEARDVMEQQKNTSAFMGAYNVHERARGDFSAKYANFSPIGRYFQALLDRLNDQEDKQIAAGKPATVTHARQLTAIIVAQLQRMCAQGQRRNEKLDQLWNLLVNASINERA